MRGLQGSEPHVVIDGEEKIGGKNFNKGSFYFFSFHPMFLFWLGLLFHFELVFWWNPWDLNKIDHWTKTYGYQLVRKSFGFFVGFFSKVEVFMVNEKIEWLFKCVGL
jgi:hypothetical protein